LRKFSFARAGRRLLLILGMLLAVAWSLDAAQWTDGMSLVQWAVLIRPYLGRRGREVVSSPAGSCTSPPPHSGRLLDFVFSPVRNCRAR